MNGLSDFISQEEAALAALKAGNDLILSSTYKTQIPVIKSAIQSGDYKEEKLDNSVLRVLTWKHELGLISFTSGAKNFHTKNCYYYYPDAKKSFILNQG